MKKIDFRDQISSNKRKSFFLMGLVAVVLVVLGYVISMTFFPDAFFTIMILVIIFSIGYTWFSFYNSHKIAIASVGAKEAKRSEFPDYYRLVESLVVASSLPMPKLYIMKSPQINAFASGRDPAHAVVCITTGAMEKLDRRELEGVLAHELGHVANYDIRYITLVSVMVGMVAIISQIFLRSLWFGGGRGSDDKAGMIFLIIGIALAIIAPIVVIMVQMSISRKREYSADATAVKFTRNPQGLIGALEKIGGDNIIEKKVSKAVAPLFFSNPFRKMGSTHPPLGDRIAALKSM
ncbi:MAG: M48 family metallopeptidase [Nanoarchaeota archaeon]|jgi:heat shock protein HtpX|nr:M48 family metallopeptidase [Nanoarchaeota archaeon]